MAAILLVDDDDLFRSLVGMFLDTVGYVCSQAVSVTQARAWLMTKQFDLILSDFNMPRESGLDLLEYVSVEHPETPFIMMTGESSPAIRRRALEMGARECLTKPFRLNGLVTTLKQVLAEGAQPVPMEAVRRPCILTPAAA